MNARESYNPLGTSHLRAKLLEARGGIEPPNKGFADLCLTTWLPRLDHFKGYYMDTVLGGVMSN